MRLRCRGGDPFDIGAQLGHSILESRALVRQPGICMNPFVLDPLLRSYELRGQDGHPNGDLTQGTLSSLGS